MLRINSLPVCLEFRGSFFLLVSLMIGSGSGVFACISLLFSLLHECAHGLTAHALGYETEKITVGLFGGVLHLKELPERGFDELLIHLAGPFFNLCCAAGFYCFAKWLPASLAEELILCSLLLGVFNLMPFYPLDGGKVICLYLSMHLGRGRALWISKNISLIFSVFLFLIGIYLIQYNSMNLLISALSVNLYFGAKADYDYALYRKTMAELQRLQRERMF